MQQIIAEGNNIGEWENKEILNINQLYIQAEDCLKTGSLMYKCDLLLEAFVYFMRMTRFYELICKNNHLIISNRRHLNIRMNVARVVSIMELIKPKLVKKYDRKKNIEELPDVPYTDKNISSLKLSNSSIITTEDLEIREKMITNLDERWQKLVSKRTPKPEPKPESKPEPKPESKPELKPESKPEPKPEPKPESKPELKPEPKPETKPEPKPESNKTTNNINKSDKILKYTNKDGTPFDALKILALHLQIYNRQIFDVPGDNNCQFHAIADQLERIGINKWSAKKLRLKAVNWLKDNEKRVMDDETVGKQTYLKDAIGIDDWNTYVEKMSKHDVTWGDEATLLALSVLFKIKINIVSSLPGNYLHVVQPPKYWDIDLKGDIYIGHYHEFHYVSTRLN